MTTDHGNGSYVDSGSADLSDLESDVGLLVNRTDGGVKVEQTTPVFDAGAQFAVVVGNTYLASDGYALNWKLEDHGLNLTGAMVRLAIRDRLRDSAAIVVEGTITETGADATFTFEPDDSITDQLAPGDFRYDFQIVLTLTNPERDLTPILGRATVRPKLIA